MLPTLLFIPAFLWFRHMSQKNVILYWGYKAFSHYHCFSLVLKRLQLLWIESARGHSFLAGNLLWPCSLIETSDTELSGIH